MKIYLVRHGQTDKNKNNIIQGVIDEVLNENGINQAKELKKKIDNLDIDLMIVSPLKRTRETAKIITENREIETIFDDRIIERNAGELEGKSNIYYIKLQIKYILIIFNIQKFLTLFCKFVNYQT